MKKQISSSLLFLFIYLTLYQEAFAQDLKVVQPSGTGIRPVGSGSSIIQKVYDSVITMIYSVAIVAFVVMLAWGALDIITSGGNKDKVQAGRKRITTAIIGITVLAFAFFIANVVGTIVGINVTGPLKIPRLFDGAAGPSAGSAAGGNVQ